MGGMEKRKHSIVPPVSTRVTSLRTDQVTSPLQEGENNQTAISTGWNLCKSLFHRFLKHLPVLRCVTPFPHCHAGKSNKMLFMEGQFCWQSCFFGETKWTFPCLPCNTGIFLPRKDSTTQMQDGRIRLCSARPRRKSSDWERGHRTAFTRVKILLVGKHEIGIGWEEPPLLKHETWLPDTRQTTPITTCFMMDLFVPSTTMRLFVLATLSAERTGRQSAFLSSPPCLL